MSKFHFIIILPAMLFFACTKDRSKHMDEEKLVRVLCDIHMAEAAMEKLNQTEKDTVAQRLYNQIYTIHSVDQASVDTVLYYLKKDPGATEKIYVKVIEKLSKLKQDND